MGYEVVVAPREATQGYMHIYMDRSGKEESTGTKSPATGATSHRDAQLTNERLNTIVKRRDRRQVFNYPGALGPQLPAVLFSMTFGENCSNSSSMHQYR